MSVSKKITVELDEAVEHDGKTYKSLTLRKMKAKDIVASDLVTGEARKGMAIFASMAGVPIQVIEDLDADDFEKLGLEAAPLMGKRGRRMAALLNQQDPEAETLLQ